MYKTFRLIAVALVAAGATFQVAQADEVSLPDGYLRLSAVGSGWGQKQMLDTGFTPCSTDLIEVKVSFRNKERGQSAILCARNSADVGVLFDYEGGDTFTVDCGNSGAGRNTLHLAIENHVDYELVEDCLNHTFSVNGEKVADLNYAAFDQAGGTMRLFAIDDGNIFAYSCYVIRSLRVVDPDGNLRLNLVPALELKTAIAGFYDTVGGNFLKAVNKGGSYVPLYYEGGMKGSIPACYRRVHWVVPTGKQVLMTCMTPQVTDSIEMTVVPLNVGVGYGLWCARDNNGGKAEFLSYFLDRGTPRFAADRGSVRQTPAATEFVLNKKCRLRSDYKTAKFYVNGVETADLGGDAGFSVVGGPLFFGAVCNGMDISSGNRCNGNYRICSARVLDENGVAKIDLVPCVDKTSGIGGLYDLAQGSFMTAADNFSNPGLDYDPNDRYNGFIVTVQ